MRTAVTLLCAIVAWGGLGGCATRTLPSPARNAVRAPIRVRVVPKGQAVLYGETLRISTLVRRLRREEDGRAVVLHAEDGVDTPQLLAIRRQLVEGGVPNVSVVTAREASVEVDGGEGAREPSPAVPPPPRVRRR